MDKCTINGLSVNCYDNVDVAAQHIINNDLNVANIAVAINPEKIIQSYKNNDLASILKSSDILYLDGIGTVKLAEYRIKKKLSRIPGCELWEKLMELSGKKQIPIYLIGGSPDVIAKVEKKLKKEYNSLIVGSIDGFSYDFETLCLDIVKTKPKIISVALGSPKQELLMNKLKAQGISCFMMGVGGTYDVYVGQVKRAPLIFRKIGLEWFYRLVCQPTRIFRQLNLLQFILLAVKKKI